MKLRYVWRFASISIRIWNSIYSFIKWEVKDIDVKEDMLERLKKYWIEVVEEENKKGTKEWVENEKKEKGQWSRNKWKSNKKKTSK